MMRAGFSARPLTVTFLGTCSGGGPILQRNCTSTMLQHGKTSWLIDCAEGTQHQLLKFGVNRSRIDKIFVTHMHVDHVFGIVPLMNSLLCKFGYDGPGDAVRLQLYGPAGLRQFLRASLISMSMNLGGKYAAHELLTASDAATPCSPDLLHPNEAAGSDIRATRDGTWQHFDSTEGWRIDAGQLVHRVPSIGYVFTEPPHASPTPAFFGSVNALPQELLPTGSNGVRLSHSGLIGSLVKNLRPVQLANGSFVEPPPQIRGRKVVVLGDTCDASGIAALAQDADLLVHEATNAPTEKCGKAEEVVREVAISRGHATPRMAGQFAREIGARALVMNHLGTRFAPNATRVLAELAAQARDAFGGANAFVGMDGMEIEVPQRAENNLAAQDLVDSAPAVAKQLAHQTWAPPPQIRYLENILLQPPAHVPDVHSRASTGHEREPHGKRVASPRVPRWSPPDGTQLPHVSRFGLKVDPHIRTGRKAAITATTDVSPIAGVPTPPELEQRDPTYLHKVAGQARRRREKMPQSAERVQQELPVQALPAPNLEPTNDGLATASHTQSSSPTLDARRDDIPPRSEEPTLSDLRPATNADIAMQQHIAAPMNDDALFDQFSWADAPLDTHGSASTSAKRDFVSDPDLAEQPRVNQSRSRSLENSAREPMRHVRALPFDVDSVNASLFGFAPRRSRSLEVVSSLQRNEQQRSAARAERQVARLRGLRTGTSVEGQRSPFREESVEDRDRAGNVVRRRKLVMVRSRIPPDALR